MTSKPTRIDLGNAPPLPEPVEDVRRSGRSRLIQTDGEDVAVLMPAPRCKRPVTKSKPVTADDPLFRLREHFKTDRLTVTHAC